ncbi:MAG: phosphoribosylformylglycinamidine synthase subunit PurQ [Rhodospirillales bacterium]|nr:MAG: phosphoribosylformylglycinamidine synthase subunit PurQ [Rhodospirillales bacterium]
MHAAVIVFPGSNCDRDVAVALTQATGRAPLMLWHRETEVPPLDLIVVPGGFSYGDYLRAGALAAHSPVVREVKARAAKGVPVLGICNGFQVLCEAGMLPGVLMRNAGLRFVCKDVWLRVENAATPFTRGYRSGQVVRMPIAHNDGNYYADATTLDKLEGEGRIVFRYCHADGRVDDAANPNGAQRGIAGIADGRGSVLGMMPHPERAADASLGGTDGRTMFQSLLTVLA